MVSLVKLSYLSILGPFGIVPDEDGDMRLPDMQAACDIAICLRYSLEAHIEVEIIRQIFFVISWLWGISGNNCILCGIEKEKSREEKSVFGKEIGIEKATSIAQIIAGKLEESEAEQYRQLSWVLKWLFSCTNNSCVDWDEETMYSVEPLSWEAENIAFAIELIAEAEQIMADVGAGLAWVQGEIGVLLALWYNIRQVEQSLASQPEKIEELVLSWPDLSQDHPSQIKHLLDEWGYPLGQSD